MTAAVPSLQPGTACSELSDAALPAKVLSGALSLISFCVRVVRDVGCVFHGVL